MSAHRRNGAEDIPTPRGHDDDGDVTARGAADDGNAYARYTGDSPSAAAAPPPPPSASQSARMAQYFHRNQTVEVLPRSQNAQPPAFSRPRPPSELYRTFTSSELLSGRGLQQRLLDEDLCCDESTVVAATGRSSMPNVTAATPCQPSHVRTRHPPLVPPPTPRGGTGFGTGLARTSSWRIFSRNLPRPLRFRQHTRSTTRYMDPANATSLRERLRVKRARDASRAAQEEEEGRGRGRRRGEDAAPGEEETKEDPGSLLLLPPGGEELLAPQRSNFADVGKYRDQPALASASPGAKSLLIDAKTPNASASNLGVGSQDDDGRGRGSHLPGRTSSLFSVETAGPQAATKARHRIVRINPESGGYPYRLSTPATLSGEDDDDDEGRQSPVLFPSNEVRTSQYSWWSFIPVFLYLTFQKTANLYFLLIGIFQMIPDISPTDGVPLQFLPLSIVTIIDAVFAAFEDYKRHLADDQANSAPTRVFNRELREFEDVAWRDIRVGDFVKILNHETIPADVLILSVVPAEGTRNGGNAGICYVETKNLDGETNLKLREAPRATRGMFDAEEDCGEALQGYLESEMPNGDINRYSGTLYIEDNATAALRSSLKLANGGENHANPDDGTIGIPIGLKNMLLRGCKLRNTKAAYGLVVNTGVDSKIMMSSGDEFPVKLSSIDEMTNKQVIMVVILLAIMSLIGGVADKSFLGNLEMPPEVDPADVPKSVLGTFVYFFTTLASMVPITLYVSITMVKALQAYFMERDLDMYDAESDVPMVARNMQLNEQLGQISHIFSDKTGTLTCNRMEFRKCSINGVSYGKGTTAIGLAARLRNDFKGDRTAIESDEEEDDEYTKCPAPNVNFKDRRLWEALQVGNESTTKIRNFFSHLALCHGVLIERLDAQPDDMEMPPIVYSASSPDEQALVSGAKYFGFEFVHREPGSVSIKTPEGVIEQYEILEVFEFDSTRKRMTVVVQKRKSDEELMQMTEDEEEDVIVLTKGADSVLFPRLSTTSANNERIRDITIEHLETFARDGLRTLVICAKVMPLHEWEDFHLRYRKVCSDLHEVEAKARGEKNAIDQLQEEMEQDLELLGATAIEDRLQDGVPETMERLARAGISIWVLTGDMEETAINIGYACRLLNNDMQRHVINSANYHTKGSILRQLDKVFHWIYEGKRIDGGADEADEIDSVASTTSGGEHALVIDGASLNLVLEDPLYNLHLLRTALLCKVVIACRVSPQQKAQLVELVKLNVPDSHTLSIGDGANDVPMIQSAHIGIGISGQEGMQAVNSSDYALGQFRFLSTLLLTHGRWNYNRVAALTVYTFYKNIVYCMSMFWYCMKPSAYSGTMIYSAFIQQGYNLFFTAIPIMVYAVFDRDLPKEVVVEYPALYHPATRVRTLFSYSMFWKWMGLAVFDSVAVLLVILAAAYNVMVYGDSVQFTVLESMAWTILCMVVNARFCLMVNSWDIFEVLGLAISVLLLYVFQYAVDLITWSDPDYDTYSFPWIFERWQFWLGQLLAIVAILFKNFLYEGYRRRFMPDYLDLVKESIYLKGDARDVEADEDLRKYSPPQPSYLGPELVNMLDYRERRVQERAPVRYTAPGRTHLYRGFAFEQPAYIVNWILSSGDQGSNAGPLRRKTMNPDVRQQILNSDDPVIFENERYQPFCGYGSTYPGYLLPTDRSRWSDRSGKISAMSIPLAGLELDMDVPGCDEEGWVYEVDFKFFPSSPPPKDEGSDVDDDEPPSSNGGSARSRPPSKKGILKSGPLRGLVRRRQWVLSERHKALARDRASMLETAESEQEQL